MSATPIFSFVNAKLILITSFLLNAISLVSFTIWKSFILLALSRFMVGFCQVSINYFNSLGICLHLFSCLDWYFWFWETENTLAINVITCLPHWCGSWLFNDSYYDCQSYMEMVFLCLGISNCSVHSNFSVNSLEILWYWRSSQDT
jgi:hypothetical protein